MNREDKSEGFQNPRATNTRSFIPRRGTTLLLTALLLALNLSVIHEAKADPWVTTGSMSTARNDHTATLLPNGKVLVAGGYFENGTNVYLSSAELYDPATGTWTNTGAMNTVRAHPTATLLPNGKVLVAGGYSDNGTYVFLSSAELYDPASGTWTNTGAMTTASTGSAGLDAHVGTPLLRRMEISVPTGACCAIASAGTTPEPNASGPSLASR